MYSAIKQDGVRLYKRARAGEEVERAPRRIRIDRARAARVRAAAGSGSRSRAARAPTSAAWSPTSAPTVGCGAHLIELRRTQSGRFSIAQALTMSQVGQGDVAPHLVAMTAATELPQVVVDAALTGRIRSGVQLPIETFVPPKTTSDSCSLAPATSCSRSSTARPARPSTTACSRLDARAGLPQSALDHGTRSSWTRPLATGVAQCPSLPFASKRSSTKFAAAPG